MIKTTPPKTLCLCNTVKELSLIDPHAFPEESRDATQPTYATIMNSFKRNQQLNRLALILVPPPPPPPPPPPLQGQQRQRRHHHHHHHHATSIMLKISHQVITKFATAGNGNKNAGASERRVFFFFQTVPSPPGTASQVRPALLKKTQIQRPAAAAAAADAANSSFSNDAGCSPIGSRIEGGT
jgi:hypothetical protein